MPDQENRYLIETILKRAGLQKTAQRLAVLDILNRAEAPLTAADVFQQLPETQKINRVTVYRILSSYTQSGIVREFTSKRGIHYYERVEPGKYAHPHFNCRACGAMICLTTNAGPWTTLTNQPDFEIESINISGLCGGCRDKKMMHHV